VPKFKEYHEKARKIHMRLQLILEFEEAVPDLTCKSATSSDFSPQNFIKQKEIIQLIKGLKMQHEFLFEVESTMQAFREIK